MTTATSTDIRPFTIAIEDGDLDDLQERLARTRFPAPLPGDDWDTGVPVGYLRELVDYWQHTYDWRREEAQLNRLPHFLTEIDGQQIHFVHLRSDRTAATPLLLTHGWPGSFVEFLELIERLRGDFHLVVPSLPGFAFSGPVTDAGWDKARIARAWVELMDRLGYARFGVQGGDIGAAVSPEVARVAPDRVIGVHLNGNVGMPLHGPDETERATLTPLEADRLARVEAFMNEEFGYIAIQSTRPQLIGAALVDSPVGLLAWIVDKFRQWTHPRSVLPDQIIDRDRLLTNVMLYWLTGTAGSAAYVGYAQETSWGVPVEKSPVPTAVIVFAHDAGVRRYAEVDHTIVRWTDVEGRGGHFAALEEPDLLAADIEEFFASLS
jgi:pimeloyl-ACP methyl ester carboxylesterase